METFNHYYFKFLKQNEGITKFLNLKEQKDLEVGDEIPLSIYFGTWQLSDYNNIYGMGEKIPEDAKFRFHVDENKVSVNQVKQFVTIGNDIDAFKNTVFWLFYNEKIYALQPCKQIVDGPIECDVKDSETKISKPKTIYSKVVNCYYKNYLPETFTTLNANQGYNRRTIQKLSGKTEEIANLIFHQDHEDLLLGKPFAIQLKGGKLNYLSPIQFETLVFLIFYERGAFCSTYRGGTLESIDLKIEIPKEIIIDGFSECGTHHIQVKFKTENKLKVTGRTFLVHLGLTNPSENTLGLDWIENQIRELPKVNSWLEKSLSHFEFCE